MNRWDRIIIRAILVLSFVTLFILLMVIYGHAESVSLTWDAPTTNTDATPLTDLAGYNIYYGTSTGVYGSPVDVGHTRCAVISGLTVGTTYYFAATAYDISANESAYSNEVSKLIASGDAGSCYDNTIHFNWKQRHRKSGGFGGGFQ